MATLTENEHIDNEKFFNEFLTTNYPNFIFPEVVKQEFLNKCRKEGIWLHGQSPIVKKPFIQALTLAIQDTQFSNEYKFNKLFQILQNKIEEERAYLKWLFKQTSSYQDVEQHTISWYLTHNQNVPADYLLQTEDMFNALAPLNKYDAIYVHQSVNEIGAAILACVENELTVNKAAVAYVPVENSEHWTLHIYTKQNGQLVHERYNSPGDGKCGDHAASYAYKHAQQFLDAADKKDLQENFGDYVNNPSTNPSIVRQQTIQLVKKGKQLLVQQANITVPEEQTANATVTDNTTVNQSTKIESYSVINKNSFAEYDQLSQQWNALANHVIDEIQYYSDTERAKLWNTFFNNAVDSIHNKTWSPVIFNSYQQCAKEVKNSNTDLDHAIQIPHFVF